MNKLREESWKLLFFTVVLNTKEEVDVIDKILVALGCAIVGIIVGYFVRRNISEAKVGQAETRAKEIIDKANHDSETVRKEKLLEAKEEIHKLRTEAEKENRERRNEVQKYERRVLQKEENLDKKRSTVKIKKTAGTISYEESKSRSKDRSLWRKL